MATVNAEVSSSPKKVIDYNDTGMFYMKDGATFDGMHFNDDQFHAKYPYRPMLIRGFGKALTEVTEDFVRSLLSQDVLSVYTGDGHIDIPKEDFVKDFMTDRPKRNLLEGISPPSNPPADTFPIPSMFADNYFSGVPTPDLLISMVLSTQNCYTKTHIDTAGSGAWMYLMAGEKRWTVYEPKFRSAMYSPRTRIYWDPDAPHAQTKEELPFCEDVPCSTVFQKAGDLIWVPPGWAHRVLTTKRAIGYGSFYVAPSIVLMSVESFLSGASYHLPDAYLGHANMVAVKKENGVETDEASEQSTVDYTSEKRDYHYATILKNIYYPGIKEGGNMVQHKEAITEAVQRWRHWQENQARSAYVYPQDAADVFAPYDA